MADQVDAAQSEQERHLALALTRHRSGAESDSAYFCLICGTRIPEARRQAKPGVRRCIHCQEQIERGVA